MYEVMNSKERMIAALSGETPDRVPAAPDMSYMVPCRLTGKPFYDVLLYQNPPLYKAYVDAVKYFGTDGWFTYSDFGLKLKSNIDYELISQTVDDGRIERKVKVITPDGEVTTSDVFFEDDVSSVSEKMVKQFPKDFNKIRHFYSEIVSHNLDLFKEQVTTLGDLGINCACIAIPGLHTYSGFFEGSLETCTYAYYDYKELFEELRQSHHKQVIQHAQIALDAGVDCVLIGASGNMTLQSPEIWEEMSLPTIKEVCELTRQAGKISGIHSCGKEAYIVKRLYEETSINYINPLELPPMGDCQLKDVKNSYGDKLSFMGNLHTVNVMLNGSVELVRLEALKAIRDAAQGGGYVLSTGDQVPRDTPDENIFEMVNVAKEYGTYPLNMDKIDSEIKRLTKM